MTQPSHLCLPRQGINFSPELATNVLLRLDGLSRRFRAGVSAREISQSVAEMEWLFADLERQVVDSDGLGPAASREELVLRAACLIVDTQCDSIELAIHAPLPPCSVESDHTDVWSRFLDAIPLGRSEIRRIASIWVPYRNVVSGAPTASNSAAYRDAVRAASGVLDNMDEIPAIERLLYRGVASRKSPEIASACEKILVAIHVHVDTQIATRLDSALRSWTRALGGR